MLGRDHIISNVCSGVLLVEGLFAVNTCYTGVYAKEVHNVTKHMIADLVHPCNLNPWLILAISVGLFLLGTLLPDIDSTTSMLGRWVHIPVEHRTWTHTIWICALLFLPCIWQKIFIWLFLGYVLHLFWDSFSRAGVCWFYPISQYRYYGNAKVKRLHILKLYRTSNISEFVIVAMLIVITVLVTVLCYKNNIIQQAVLIIKASL